MRDWLEQPASKPDHGLARHKSGKLARAWLETVRSAEHAVGYEGQVCVEMRNIDLCVNNASTRSLA